MRTLPILAVLAAAVALSSAPAHAQGAIELISVSSTGGPSDGYSYEPSISATGRYVTFYSQAANLVSPATTGSQVFVRDRQLGTTELVSWNSAGNAGGNSTSYDPFISADGRHVVFASSATDIVSSPTVSAGQVYVRDLDADTTELVSWNLAGDAGGNAQAWAPVISGDNRYVAFVSNSSDLVAGGNTWQQIYVRDLVTDTTILVSVAETDAGIEPGNSTSAEPSISGDGRYVAFESYATNLVDPAPSSQQVYRRDLLDEVTELASMNATGDAAGNGMSYHARITPDGRWVSFASDATDLVSPATSLQQMFLRDMASGTTVLVSQSTAGVVGNGGSGGYGGGLSSDGRYVSFTSYADNLISVDSNGTADIFVRDHIDATTTRAGEGLDGGEPNGMSETSSISADGRFVAFNSGASNLVPGDTNGTSDVFVYEVFVPLPDAGVDGGADGGLDAGIDGGDLDTDGDSDTGVDTDTGSVDGDSDSDSDTDSDTDSDSDTDTDADGDSDTGTGDVDTGSDTGTGAGGDGGGDAGSDGDGSSGCGCATAGEAGRAGLVALLGALL